MAISNLSFSATEKLRKDLLVRNLEPYFVRNSSTQLIPKSQVGAKEFIFSEVPLINQPDLADTGKPEKTRLYGVNQYGPTGGYINFVTLPLLVKTANQGEFQWYNGVTRKFSESSIIQKELIVTNQYGPQDGWEDGSSNLEVNIKQNKDRDEYFDFIPSTYSPFNILISPNPVGSDGRLSQDSALAQISATNLKKLFQESIAFETYQQTLGRANVLQTNGDPYRILNLATGRDSLIEPDYKITVPSSLIGRGIDFISRIAGLYSPYSIIPGEYFSTIQNKSLTNQVINTVAGIFGFPKVLPERKSSSDVFLSFTSGGQKKALFSNIRANRYAPDYKGNFLGNLNLTAPPGNYYIGSRLSEPLDIVSPSGQIPVNEFGVEIETNVYGPSVLGKLYENDVNFEFGLNSTPTIEGGGVQGGFTWVSPKYKGNAGKKVGPGGDIFGQDEIFSQINGQYSRNQSVNYPLKKGSILDDTQRIIESQPPNGGKRLQHVGNAIDQVSKVFNDGYKEITKGSRVVRYIDNNGTFKGEEYGRVFAKDIPYFDMSKLQKMDGNIRKNPFSILNSTYNLNMYPTSGPESTTLGGASVKKYMLSLENLAWRSSRRAGVTYNDLPESEKGPNGGRIMWFPPYDLNFSDSSSTGWEKNTFLGRPEPIYTYQSTERTGQISFKIVVDHPSIMNVLVNKVLTNPASNQVADQVLDSFFAGLTKFDIYELSKRYTNFSQTELAELQNLINNSGNREKIKNAVNSTLTPGGDGAGGSMSSNNSVGEQQYIPQLTKFENSVFYFDDNLPGPTSDYISLVESYITSNGYNNDINDTQKNEITDSKDVLTAFTQSINNLLESNNNVKIQIKIKGGSSYNEGQEIQENRVSCLISTIKTLIKDNPKVSFVNEFVGSTLETLVSPPYDCNTVNNSPYGTGPVACRRAVITDIVETPIPNLNNPNGGVTTNQPTRFDRILAAGRGLTTPTSTNTQQGLTQEQISKKVIRKLLSEADYFQFVKESNPFVYDSLKEKLKYFHPAFHSMTPEGLNERLTFLNQCVRPGDTIPTKKSDNTLVDKDARNTSFGAPPVCILRVGDFFHSKVVLDGVSFSYEDSKFDLNPEGIGVQPMIVGVTINFKFIGGQGLRGPIDELQNALSFNFYANTEMYDERATDSSTLSAYNKEFIEETENTGENTVNTNSTLQNDAGTTIGAVQGAFENSGTTALLSYKPIFQEFVNSFESYIEGVQNKLKEVHDEYNDGILMLYTKSSNGARQYIDGKINKWEVGGSAKDVQIFGKSIYDSRITQLFDGLQKNIDDNSLSMLNAAQLNLTTNVFREQDLTIFKNNLTTLLREKKTNFPTKLNQITNDLSTLQLNMTKKIDKLNYVLQNTDGYIDTKGIPQIYDTSGSTVDNLRNDLLIFGDKLIAFYSGLNSPLYGEPKTAIISDEYNDDQTYKLPGSGFQSSPSDKRFYLVFGKDIVNDSDAFVQSLIVKIDQKNKSSWEKFVKSEIEKIKKQAENEYKVMKKVFSDSKSQNAVKNFKPDKIATMEKDQREVNITLKTSPSEQETQRLKNLYTSQNSDPDTNTFNGKITF